MTFNTGDKVKLVPFEVAQARLPEYITKNDDYILGISRERYESYLDKELTIEADESLTCRLVEDRLKFSWLVTCFDLVSSAKVEETEAGEDEEQFETPVECMTWLIGEFDEIVDMIDPTDISETYHKVRAALVRILEEFTEEEK